MVVKKRIKAVIAIIIICIIVIGIYLIYNRMFPYAKPIDVTSIESISSVYLSTHENMDEKIALSEDDFIKITGVISGSKPTRIMSVNDYPTVRPYYMIEIINSERNIRYFVYEENATTYLEAPYEGIYIVDAQIVDVIEDYLNVG